MSLVTAMASSGSFKMPLIEAHHHVCRIPFCSTKFCSKRNAECASWVAVKKYSTLQRPVADPTKCSMQYTVKKEIEILSACAVESFKIAVKYYRGPYFSWTRTGFQDVGLSRSSVPM